MNLKLSDQETGYYVGIAYTAKMYHNMIEDFQESGLDPYKIVDAILFSNSKLHEESMQKLKDSGYAFKNEANNESNEANT